METKSVNLSLLLELYKPMLTDKQQLAIELYVNEDYSLREIAEHTGGSRQAVQDTLKRAEAHLLQLEQNLQMLHKFTVMQNAIDKLSAMVQNADMKQPIKQSIQGELAEISAIWEE